MINAIHSLFNNVTLRKLYLKLRYVVAAALVVVLVINIQREWLLAAFIVSMIGEFIQLWSFASLVKNEELTARGPYVLVRNPMYLGRFVLLLGFVLLLNNHYVTATYCVFYYFYMVNRVQREEQRLQRLLGEPYEKYCQEVNRFLPALSRLGEKSVWFFDRRVMMSNNGHWNLLAVLAVYGLIYAYVLYFNA